MRGNAGKAPSRGREALERPYRQDHEQSLQRRMGGNQAQMPRTLDALVAWVMTAACEETPGRLHKPGVWHDHAEGGSHLGSPALATEFRRYLENGPSAVDDDGYYRTPLRAAISRLRREMPTVAQDVDTLIRCGGDWRRLAEYLHMDRDVASLYLREALRRAWREFAVEVVRLS